MPIPVPISAHDEPLPPDELFTIQFNYEWRRLVAELVWQLTFDSFWSGSPADITDAISKARALIEDLYTSEPIGGAVDYLGAQVARTTSLAIGTTMVNIAFDDDTTRPMHNDSAMWNVLVPAKIGIVPGEDGFYFCHGHVRVQNAVNGVILRLSNGASEFYARARKQVAGIQSLHVGAVVFFDGADGVRLSVQTVSGTSVLTTGGFFPVSATLGMYRVGLAP